MITKNMSLADIVKELPGAIDLFNEYKLDYCCGGKDVLEEALKEVNLDVDEFVNKLNNEKDQYTANQQSKISTSLYSLNVEELIDFIEDSHHIEERELLQNLDRLVNKILIVHYEHHSEELIKVHHLFSDLKKELEEHFVKEEQVVFPMMKENAIAEDQLLFLIEGLKAEHEAAGEIIKQLQAVTNDFNPPKDACPTFISTYQNLEKLVNDIFLHIYAETSVLFVKFE